MNSRDKMELKEFLDEYVGIPVSEHSQQLIAIHGTLKANKHLIALGNKVTLDDLYDDLPKGWQKWVDKILAHSGEIVDAYHEKWWRNGGWNGFMDAMGEIEKRYRIKEPKEEFYPDEEFPPNVNFHELLVKQIKGQ